MAAQKKQRNAPAENLKKMMKRHAFVEPEMRGVAVCAASQVKGVGSEGKGKIDAVSRNNVLDDYHSITGISQFLL